MIDIELLQMPNVYSTFFETIVLKQSFNLKKLGYISKTF